MKYDLDYSKLSIDSDSSEPLHMQLKRALKRELRGLMPNRQVILMSERELASMLKLSRPTVHRVYDELLTEGIVSRRADRSLEVCPQARSRIVGNYRVIGVLLPTDFPTFVDRNNSVMNYLKGIIGRASELNISCLMLQPPTGEITVAALGAFVEAHFPKLCGVIHLGGLYDDPGENDAVLTYLMSQTEIPQVCLSGVSSYSNVGAVYADPAVGVRELFKSLKARKIHSIGIVDSYGMVRTPAEVFTYISSIRIDAMLNVAGECGVDCRISVGKNEYQQWLHQVIDLLQSPNRPEVLICYNDTVARTVMELARLQGIAVPDELSVVGYDGGDPELASIRTNQQQVAEAAVEMIVEHFEHGVSKTNRILTLPTEFADGRSLKRTAGGAAKPRTRRKPVRMQYFNERRDSE